MDFVQPVRRVTLSRGSCPARLSEEFDLLVTIISARAGGWVISRSWGAGVGSRVVFGWSRRSVEGGESMSSCSGEKELGGGAEREGSESPEQTSEGSRDKRTCGRVEESQLPQAEGEEKERGGWVGWTVPNVLQSPAKSPPSSKISSPAIRASPSW